MTDPNADLIGRMLTIEGSTFTVTDTASWNTDYVNVRSLSGSESCLMAQYIRNNLASRLLPAMVGHIIDAAEEMVSEAKDEEAA